MGIRTSSRVSLTESGGTASTQVVKATASTDPPEAPVDVTALLLDEPAAPELELAMVEVVPGRYMTTEAGTDFYQWLVGGQDPAADDGDFAIRVSEYLHG